MKSIPIGRSHTNRIETTHAHTADALGNRGVTVIATPILIGFLEMAAHGCIEPLFDEGEGSVGTHVNVRHLAAAPAGTIIEASATVTAAKGRQVTFAVEAKWKDRLLMDGSHTRAVVDLARFFARLGIAPPK